MDELPLAFHPDVRFDAVEAQDWYTKRSDTAADAFVAELEAAGKAIQRSPLLWRKYLSGTRRYLLKRFPYLVVYRVTETRIEIIAVVHGRRKPGFWRQRLKNAF